MDNFYIAFCSRFILKDQYLYGTSDVWGEDTTSARAEGSLLTVKKKFAALLVTVASTVEEEVCRALMKKVHMRTLQSSRRRRHEPRNTNTT